MLIRETTSTNTGTTAIPVDDIARAILVLRGQKVLLDADLAELYGVATKVLVQAVKRNRERFPDDFMFQLTVAELDLLRSQNVTSSSKHGGRRYPPAAAIDSTSQRACYFLRCASH